ncbi:MAG: ABC transporter permease [Micrococcales bacterium 70-64]|nr:ABC transporter permease [Leifsonia sp.]ODU66009.1 MAG: ABC transporter permease [Leifsonia sp. SCN 70-46]OJX84635.1 MAG: ABC transporter permease [Micrococcales bacterium 70-64]
MWSYVLRRVLIAILVIFAASFLVYVLAANSGDPLEDLRGSTAPNKEALIAARIQLLHLDIAPPLRYFLWLSGVLKIFIGQLDLGATLTGSAVTTILSQSMWSTLQLVSIATVLAILFGVSIGMISALRQYSGFDYSVTLIAFFFFALPTFWVGQLLKLNVAISFNNFLASPQIPPPWVVGISLVLAFIWASAMGGQLKRFAINFGGAAVITAGILVYINLTDSLRNPNLGPVWIGIIGVAAAIVITQLTTGLSNRRALYSSLTVAVLGAILWWPVQFAFYYAPEWWAVLLLALVALGVGALVGWLFGGDDRGVSIRAAMITAFVSGLLVLVDRIMGAWPDYVANTGGRPISTIGSETAGLKGSIWLTSVDSFAHVLLPTLTIMLISLAAYSRYSRGSLLEVMSMDYVRTARAKGLNERTVIMRHAFRNALIPIATIVAFDLGGLIGGAVITETVFAWRGMGTMFVQALRVVDLNSIMGVFLVTSLFALLFNLLADIAYSVLDPRIRVS